MNIYSALRELPLIAILRGIKPPDAAAIGAALVRPGFRLIEVPLNSPDPLHSIETLVALYGDRALIGAGTVRTDRDVARVAGSGGSFIVMPHADTAVIRSAKAHELACIPGVATPTEAFSAIDAGADALKLFPGEALTPRIVRAWRAVFPPSVPLLPVGGIDRDNMPDYVRAGADGFGLGSALFKPGADAAAVEAAAAALIACWRTHKLHN